MDTSIDPLCFVEYIMDEDEDEEEEEEEIEGKQLMLILTLIATNNPRLSFFVRNRMEYDSHVEQLFSEGPSAFRNLYRMGHASFHKLCKLIDAHVSVDEDMSRRRSGKGPITTEIALHCLLRWLAGGSYLDIRLSAGISITSFHFCLHKCIDAILMCDELAYSFPNTIDDIQQAANDFRSKSTNGVIDGCVACLDGLLLRIQTPSSNETGNVKAYFSGHYQAYGINVQAACDSNCRFVYAALAAPGGANDIAAFRKTSLHNIANQLPLGKYIIGDNAYVCTEHLLTPFPGEQKNEPKKDSYNFYLSQLRMRIEMAFGLLVNKWRIFKHPLQVKLKNVGKVFICATILHNYCINEGEDDNNDAAILNDSDGDSTFVPSDIATISIQGNSMMRDILVDEIATMGLSRPSYNLQRNN
jgi:DDE superfamily endonuclease